MVDAWNDWYTGQARSGQEGGWQGEQNQGRPTQSGWEALPWSLGQWGILKGSQWSAVCLDLPIWKGDFGSIVASEWDGGENRGGETDRDALVDATRETEADDLEKGWGREGELQETWCPESKGLGCRSGGLGEDEADGDGTEL